MARSAVAQTRIETATAAIRKLDDDLSLYMHLLAEHERRCHGSRLQTVIFDKPRSPTAVPAFM
jgi:hypothetical protein